MSMAVVQGYRVQANHEQSFDVSAVYRDVVENDAKYVLAYTTITKHGPYGARVITGYGDSYVAYCAEELEGYLSRHDNVEYQE